MALTIWGADCQATSFAAPRHNELAAVFRDLAAFAATVADILDVPPINVDPFGGRVCSLVHPPEQIFELVEPPLQEPVIRPVRGQRTELRAVLRLAAVGA
jgi:hypothetical protein